MGIIDNLFRKNPPVVLIVEGVVLEAGVHQPHPSAAGKPLEEERYLTLEVRAACDTRGVVYPASSVVPPEFTGLPALLEPFEPGDAVRITTTTATGRQIRTLERIAEERKPG